MRNAMTRSLIAILFAGCWLSTTAYAEQIDVSRLADAIYRAEGGAHTRFPYGIKSVVCHGEVDCRRVAMTSIKNNIKRWNRAGQLKPFIEFMADRWISVKADKVGHWNWIRNVNKIYGSDRS